MDVLSQLLLFIVAFAANAASALAGGGAGLLQLPAIIFLGLPFPVALATHKVATVALGLGAGGRHFRERLLEKPFVLLMLLAGLPGVVLGARLVVGVPQRSAELALGGLTVALALYSALRPQLGQHWRPRHRDVPGYLIGAVPLFLCGMLNGSLTSGSGLFVTLWLVRWFGLDYKRAVAHTMVMVGLFWNGTGALTLGLVSEIHWPWLPVLIAGSLLGGYVGAHWGIARGSGFIKRVFEVVTLLVGLKLLLG
ncbi:sulfite exporter TauE/SafE family protein [Alkalilimnicola sp. S0819]|uniref:sulfite exporter TauE/SafE family protein n=1 Tax=Alkalilimnicola sp. S0819 TaxID=2613922 RepID=UPI001262519D|nr:sulfite exporter TauE/SafE family protein [Alkalilimnicola sp. S0819]KAB7627378.1 sulfite exporter TauE/SafE family protein [Alkalilimnicola sp. S0819]MPQ16097.1 TSUP family transporter [Alkalilimnicola sp. S0819]